jgi:hypothetical protein
MTHERDRFAGILAITVGPVFDALERGVNLGDELALPVAGPQFDRPVCFRGCPVGETRSKRPLQGRLALRKGRRCQVHRLRPLILFLPQHLPGLQVDQMHPRTGEARKRLIGVIIVDQPALAAKLLNNIGFRFTPKGNCGRASPPPSGLGLRNESRSDAGQTRAHPSA